jgi:hypothetical protein
MVVESGTMAHTAECRVHRLVADVLALGRLPGLATVAHGGWVLGVLEEVLARPV